MSFRQNVQRTIGRVFPADTSTNRPARALELHNRALQETVLELLEALGAVVDSLNTHTLDHSVKVGKYARALAQSMGLPPSAQDRIFQAALVHDIGMIMLSSAVTRPGALTEEEIDLLRLHPTVSGEIVGRIRHLSDLAPLVHYHHERFDGTGYPDRLTGDEIPLEARILALSDSVDAMLTGRPGREPRTLEQVIEEVRRCSGEQFDPQVVDAFVALAAERGESFFISQDPQASGDMLLLTVGVSSGHARKIIEDSNPS